MLRNLVNANDVPQSEDHDFYAGIKTRPYQIHRTASTDLCWVEAPDLRPVPKARMSRQINLVLEDEVGVKGSSKGQWRRPRAVVPFMRASEAAEKAFKTGISPSIYFPDGVCISMQRVFRKGHCVLCSLTGGL